jgi:hypothetical protein
VTVDVPRIEAALRAFASRHRVRFEGFGTRRSRLLELSALMLAINHYALKGYTVGAENADGGVFRVKRSANGLPGHFSWFRAERNGAASRFTRILRSRARTGRITVSMLSTLRWWKQAASPVPNPPMYRIRHSSPSWRQRHWSSIRCSSLNFIGIVHETKREFLRTVPPPRIVAEAHFYPCPAALGHLHGRSVTILAAYERRGFWIQVVHSFDLVVSGRGLAYAGESALRP